MQVPDDVPKSERTWYLNSMRWLNFVIEELSLLNLERVYPKIFSGQLLSIEFLPHPSEEGYELDRLYVGCLLKAGLDAIDIYLWPSLYEVNRHRYDKIVNQIRNEDKKLIMGYQVLPKRYKAAGLCVYFDTLFKKPPTFEEFLKIEKAFTEEYISRYKPDYYLPVVEPITNELRVGSIFSPLEWKRLLNECCSIIKDINPETKVGAALTSAPSDQLLIDAFLDIKDLDFIGLNIYSHDALGILYSLARKAREKDKSLWISETWLTNARPHFYEYWRADLDSKWLRAMTYICRLCRIECLNVWWTMHFILYENWSNKDEYVKKMIKALKEGEETKTLIEFKKIIKEARVN